MVLFFELIDVFVMLVFWIWFRISLEVWCIFMFFLEFIFLMDGFVFIDGFLLIESWFWDDNGLNFCNKLLVIDMLLKFVILYFLVFLGDKCFDFFFKIVLLWEFRFKFKRKLFFFGEELDIFCVFLNWFDLMVGNGLVIFVKIYILR